MLRNIPIQAAEGVFREARQTYPVKR